MLPMACSRRATLLPWTKSMTLKIECLACIVLALRSDDWASRLVTVNAPFFRTALKHCVISVLQVLVNGLSAQSVK